MAGIEGVTAEEGITTLDGARDRCYYDETNCKGFVWKEAEGKAYFVMGEIGEATEEPGSDFYKIV